MKTARFFFPQISWLVATCPNNSDSILQQQQYTL